MADVSAAISAYIRDNIRLSKADISSSATSRDWLLTRVASEIDRRTQAGEIEPCLHPDQFVYFGSYFKGTKVATVDEYDVLIVIDSNTGVFSQSGVEIGTGLGTAYPNHKYNSRYYKSDGSGVSPAKMLNWLKGVVTDVVSSYGGEAPERAGQAVTARIASKGIAIDFVPAGIFRRISDGTTFYNIPLGDQHGGWIVTSPQFDIERLNTVAKGKGNFKNVIRIAKRIKTTYNFQVSSFSVETAVVDYGTSSAWRNDLFLDTFGALLSLEYAFRRGSILDPYDQGKNLVDGVESLEWYADRIKGISDTLVACISLPDDAEARARVYAAFENAQPRALQSGQGPGIFGR